jgi:hypothetical protein
MNAPPIFPNFVRIIGLISRLNLQRNDDILERE